MKRFLHIFFTILFSINFYSQSQNENPKSFEAIKIDSEQITLDGILDEPFWDNIIGINDFLMQEPIEGSKPTENTVIKIAYDQNYLYIGAILYDSNPDGIQYPIPGNDDSPQAQYLYYKLISTL